MTELVSQGTENVPPLVPVPDEQQPPRRRGLRPTRGWLSQGIFLTILAGLSALFVYPFVWAVSASLKPQAEVFDNRIIPQTFQPGNYCCDEPSVWNIQDAPVPRWLFNSLWLGGLDALLVTLASALVAFSFAYFRFPGRNFLFGLVLATLMLPNQVMMIPRYLIWNELGLVNTQYPLWVPGLFGSAFFIFLQRQFFLGIPRELFEAARIDGDNYWTMFWRIAVPLAKPALIVTFIFEFQAKWFDLMDPLIYLRDTNLFTLPLGLKTILDSFGSGGGGEGEWQIIVAATVIATIPMIIIFGIFQRYFVTGIATTGRKG
jgi:multiple sugar transport system permease protein